MIPVPQFCGCVRALAASDAKGGYGEGGASSLTAKGGRAFCWACRDRVRSRVSMAVVPGRRKLRVVMCCGVAEHL